MEERVRNIVITERQNVETVVEKNTSHEHVNLHRRRLIILQEKKSQKAHFLEENIYEEYIVSIDIQKPRPRTVSKEIIWTEPRVNGLNLKMEFDTEYALSIIS